MKLLSLILFLPFLTFAQVGGNRGVYSVEELENKIRKQIKDH